METNSELESDMPAKVRKDGKVKQENGLATAFCTPPSIISSGAGAGLPHD